MTIGRYGDTTPECFQVRKEKEMSSLEMKIYDFKCRFPIHLKLMFALVLDRFLWIAETVLLKRLVWMLVH